MLQKIYIARHGYRLNWVTSNWQSKTGLPRDPPLAAFGESQARELADYFLSLPEQERPTAIFSSPFCLFFASIMLDHSPTSSTLGLPIYVEHGLAEWFSPVAPGTGLHPRPGSAESLKEYFPEVDPVWSSVWFASRKGEDVDIVHDRIDGFLQAFQVALERRFPGKHSHVLFVTHAATAIALVRSLLGDRTFPIRIGCCSLSEFDRPTGDQRVLGSWVSKRLGDGAHLKEGTSRDWGFEDIEISGGKVVDDPGVPGSELEKDEPVGSQITFSSNL
ncbi:hypothetical protein H0H93_012516 [Arthromyces matolae]|nr:hypothetical protein H0H93_012516 [Arthromyces matolae]